jgi:hypothetical protein
MLIINVERHHSFQQLVVLVHGEGHALISKNAFGWPFLR